MNNQPSNRYTIETVKPGLYYVTDNKTHASVTFHQGRFQESQEWYFPADPAIQNPVKMHRIADAIESWLTWHHADLMGVTEKYSLQFSEDKQTIIYTRHGMTAKPGDPTITITFPASCYKKTIAALIRNAGKHLRDYEDDWHTVDFR